MRSATRSRRGIGARGVLEMEEAREILRGYPLSAADREWVIRSMARNPADALLRGSAVTGLVEVVTQRVADEVTRARYVALWERFRPLTPMSQCPINELWLLQACASAVSFPGRALGEAIEAFIVETAKLFRDHPLIVIYKRATSSFEEFLPIQMRAFFEGQPGCRGDFYWLGPRSAETVMEVPAADYLAAGFKGVWRALFNIFEIKGEARVVEADTERLIITASWGSGG